MSDLRRVPAEDRRQVQTEIQGVRYTQRDGYFEMPPGAEKLHRQSANLPKTSPAAGPMSRRFGYRCDNPECGFGSLFTTCSRCKGTCSREG